MEEQTLADVDNAINRLDSKLLELAQEEATTRERLERAGERSEEKFSLLAKEMQKVKSQIYYLQQGVLQLRVQHQSNATEATGESRCNFNNASFR